MNLRGVIVTATFKCDLTSCGEFILEDGCVGHRWWPSLCGGLKQLPALPSGMNKMTQNGHITM